MELKRILARDTRSAMEQAIKTYGPDVLVISNHQVAGQTELVVAIEVPLEAGPASEQASAGSTQAQALDAPAAGDTLSASFRDSFEQARQGALRPPPSPGAEAVGTAAALSAPLAAHPAPPAAAPGSVPAASPRAASAGHGQPPASEQDARDYLRSREIVEMVREEISALRREFRMRQQTSAWQGSLQLAPALSPLAQALQEAGIPGALRTLLLDGLSQASDACEGLHRLREQLLHHLRRPAGTLPSQGVHVLAGPSGTGKSLMTARLAGLAAQSGCEQVAVIAYQDVRAGAWSQTQMLAAQLGVDAYRAADAQALRLLVDELSSRKLVLIDTAGVQMSEHLGQILAQASACQCHAVLPADASMATVQRVLGQGLPFKSLLLTKLDEASSPWALLQFLSDNALPIAGASHGVRPSDFSPDFNLEQLVDLALAPLAGTIDRPTLIAAAEPAMAALSAYAAIEEPGADLAEATPAHEPLSASLASMARLPAVPAFLSTAQVLATTPLASSTLARPRAAASGTVKTKATQSAESKGLASKNAASKNAASKNAASKSTASKSTASKSTASKSTASKSTVAKSAAAKSTSSTRGTASKAVTRPTPALSTAEDLVAQSATLTAPVGRTRRKASAMAAHP